MADTTSTRTPARPYRQTTTLHFGVTDGKDDACK